jgi:DNA (cytosine-5)-methyltransferase 1
MTTTLKYGSLFSGVGGFDLGFDQESYECVFQVEWDKHCQKILAKHWPTVPKWSDVQDVNGAEIPPCDVLTFGSPCQDLSVAGKRAGLDGTKSSMFYEATRIIQEMRNATKSIYPRIVVWENVPGALSSNNGADFGAVINTLADIGAVDIQWSVLDAQYFGVPQRRRRIFLIAQFDPATSERCPDPLLPIAEGSRGDFAKGRKARQDAARSATPGIDSGGQWWDGQTTAECLTRTSNEQRMPDKNRLQAVIVPNDASQIAYKPTGFADYSQGIGTLRTTEMGASASHLVTTHPTYAFDTQFGSNAAVFENQSPTLKATQQSPSVTLPGFAIRRLTPLECERLMGWPDDHTRFYADGTEQADTHRYRQCGNGVATPVARFIAKHLKKILITNDDQ